MYTKQENYYICNSCGATILVSKKNQLTKCTYCGSQMVIVNKEIEKFNITKIIPFDITEKEILNRQSINQKIIAVNKIYIPFYIGNFDYNGIARYECRKVTKDSCRIYDYEATISDEVRNALFTSSKYTINSIEGISNIDYSKAVDFDPTWLDEHTVEIYDVFDFEKTAKQYANEKIKNNIVNCDYNFYQLKNESSVISNLQVKTEGILIPVFEIVTQSNKKKLIVGSSQIKSNEKFFNNLLYTFFSMLLKIGITALILLFIYEMFLKDINFNNSKIITLVYFAIMFILFIATNIKITKKNNDKIFKSIEIKEIDN